MRVLSLMSNGLIWSAKVILRIASDGIRGLELFRSVSYDLVILDLMLPGMQGIDVCQEIRKTSSVPIIMVTARSGEDDVISGLDAGADDYIIKPFSPRVLMARIRANSRKTGEYMRGTEYCSALCG